ncbi:hypothetical protein AJ79_02842 [Helicocarpus griseus UAMH5409]|uniref:Uncharacterized protein n=1 Tax=Helicocarpus griseus UAMH5409 TaxID=1447875 RepID=A0A2B7XZM9_9EURO|nr:hypothetical protein AJ79_02842 [Helicocarpus griseus UAMH5409]
MGWLQDHLERRRIRRHGNRRVLDERFGDMAITAPMAGGWNQLPVNSIALGEQAPMGYERDSKGTGSKAWMKYCLCDREDEKDAIPSDTQLSLSPTEKERTTPNCSARNSVAPAFVYKPASEEFLKQMAEIGKPKSPPNVPGMNDGERHRRKHSSISSTRTYTDPASVAGIPRHPSYHSQPLTASSSSHTPVGSRSPSSTLVASGDRQPFQTSPTLSSLNTPSTAKHSSPGSVYLEPEKTPLEPVKERYTPPVQPPPGGKSKKNRKKTRVITEELVPSEEELFG